MPGGGRRRGGLGLDFGGRGRIVTLFPYFRTLMSGLSLVFAKTNTMVEGFAALRADVFFLFTPSGHDSVFSNPLLDPRLFPKPRGNSHNV